MGKDARARAWAKENNVETTYTSAGAQHSLMRH
jgi:hypothetical protein